MRTPREVLLRRHQDADARLDEIRNRVLAEELRNRVAVPVDNGGTMWSGGAQLALKLWNELFWSCRRAWLVLGVAWVVIFAVNMTGPDDSTNRWAAGGHGGGDIWALLVERQRLSAELMDSTPQRPVVPPRPRSDYRIPGRVPPRSFTNEDV